MFSQNALKKSARPASLIVFRGQFLSRRFAHYDGRNRLSNFWTPTQSTQDIDTEARNGHELLVRAGFLRQAYSGIFHLLPLGLRVQNKIERLIDKHMQRIGAAKVSLSSLSSEDLWQRSGRLDKGRTSELLRFEDRKGSKYLLSPTHEEEITTIVANAVQSYKDLPLRLYQVSRKYRDEPRPRQGLLRGREFVMKDLYTFDATIEEAQRTYEEVRRAYVAFLEDLRLPYLPARASSGNMGGDLSHEYHFASPHGEDTIIKCDSCDYSLNEELYIGESEPSQGRPTGESHAEIATQTYISKDRKNLCTMYYSPQDGEPNIYAIKAIFPSVDSAVQDEAVMAQFKGTPEDHSFYCDPRHISSATKKHNSAHSASAPPPLAPAQINNTAITLTKARNTDTCPTCTTGKLTLHQAVEIGHTFHLGQRYSIPLSAHIANHKDEQVAIEMGCHGIGVSRLIGAIASLMLDDKGLNWPLAIAPFDVMVLPDLKVGAAEAEGVYDRLAQRGRDGEGLDVAIDDRKQGLVWKMKDADLVGYPFLAVLGKAWKSRGEVELQCRRLGVREDVPLGLLEGRVRGYSKRL